MAKRAEATVEETKETTSFIKVRSGIEKRSPRERKLNGDPVAFFEKDERHPNEEDCFIADPDLPVTVFPTAGVLSAISEGKLIQVTDDDE
jgi:hypothetical protein